MEGIASFLGGTHTMTIDDKGRLTVPSSFRKALGEEIVLRKNTSDRCVEILSPGTWNLFLQQLASLPAMDVKANRLRAVAAANAVYTTIDKQGRVLIPSEMKDFAGISGAQAVVTGAINHVRVWDPGTWAAVQAEWEKEDLFEYVNEKYKI